MSAIDGRIVTVVEQHVVQCVRATIEALGFTTTPSEFAIVTKAPELISALKPLVLEMELQRQEQERQDVHLLESIQFTMNDVEHNETCWFNPDKMDQQVWDALVRAASSSTTLLSTSTVAINSHPIALFELDRWFRVNHLMNDLKIKISELEWKLVNKWTLDQIAALPTRSTEFVVHPVLEMSITTNRIRVQNAIRLIWSDILSDLMKSVMQTCNCKEPRTNEATMVVFVTLFPESLLQNESMNIVTLYHLFQWYKNIFQSTVSEWNMCQPAAAAALSSGIVYTFEHAHRPELVLSITLSTPSPSNLKIQKAIQLTEYISQVSSFVWVS